MKYELEDYAFMIIAVGIAILITPYANAISKKKIDRISNFGCIDEV